MHGLLLKGWNSTGDENHCSPPSITDKLCGVRGDETTERLREEDTCPLLICSLGYCLQIRV